MGFLIWLVVYLFLFLFFFSSLLYVLVEKGSLCVTVDGLELAL